MEEEADAKPGSAAPPALRPSRQDLAPTVLLVAAFFVPQVAAGVYGGLGREPPRALLVLGTLFLFAGVANWFWSYCRRQRVEWIIDMGWFLMMAWPIVIPYLMIQREGRRGLARVALLSLTYFAALATSWATAIWVRLLFASD